MNKQQQELYEKLLNKVNEYCLGAAAEDVIAAIDALVDDYEGDITEANGYATLYSDVLAIIKNKRVNTQRLFQVNNAEEYNKIYSIGCLLKQEEYELLKKVL